MTDTPYYPNCPDSFHTDDDAPGHVADVKYLTPEAANGALQARAELLVCPTCWNRSQRHSVESACPTCGDIAVRYTYDIGSGPELSCASCEWCWGADGQVLKPFRPGRP